MPKPWYLGVGEYALLAAYYVVMGLGPPAYLLWAWRRWGSRQRLAIHAALLPVGLFVLAGGLGAALALVEVLHSPPTRTVFSMRGPWEYVAYSYWKLGAGARGRPGCSPWSGCQPSWPGGGSIRLASAGSRPRPPGSRRRSRSGTTGTG